MASSSFADRTPRRRHLLIGAAGAAAVLAAVVVAVLAVRSGASDATPPARVHSADKAFSVVLPDGWRALRGAELRTVPSAPAAVLLRTDGRAVILVHERPALKRSSRSLTRDLTARLERRFRGLQPVSARTVALRGGPAYVYTFARPADGRVQSIAVVPRGAHTYTLDAVAHAGAPDAAAQVGAILRSFETTTAPRS
jgi:hypothetical protein